METIKKEIKVKLEKLEVNIDDNFYQDYNCSTDLINTDTKEWKYAVKSIKDDIKDDIKDSKFSNDINLKKFHSYPEKVEDISSGSDTDLAQVPDTATDHYSLNTHEEFLNSVHSSSTEVKKPKFTCNHCGQGFREEGRFTIHIRTHTGEKPYECSFCCKRFISKCPLKRHIETHREKSVACTLCNKLFKKVSYLKLHVARLHASEKFFKCSHCRSEFHLKEDLVRHLHRSKKCFTKGNNVMLNPRESECSNKVYICNDCGKSFKLRDVLVGHVKRHLKKNHPSANGYICNECGKTYKKRDAFVEHSKVHLKNNYYVCKICGKTLYKRSIKNHRKVHENLFLFTCTVCNKVFKRKGDLTVHMKNKHSDVKPFNCSVCQSSFKKSGNLKSHIEVHHSGDKTLKYFCELCKAGFYRQVYLNSHLKIHNETEKRCICDTCGYRCRVKSDMERHVTTHVGGAAKPFQCDTCEKTFIKRSHLVRHQLVHSDKQNFKCTVCDKAYKHPGSLKSHQETHSYNTKQKQRPLKRKMARMKRKSKT